MPLQNRVTPSGEIIAHPGRGGLMGNRGGRLHDEDRRLGSRRWVSRAWICCVLCFKGRRRTVMGPGYTELFFLDEPTALAAGHRPCFECRRAAAGEFAGAWAGGQGLPGPVRVAEMDRLLHAERTGGARPRLPAAALPDGVMIEHPDGSGQALLLWQGWLYPWSPTGYAAGRPTIDKGEVSVLTPPSIIAALTAGYRPLAPVLPASDPEH
jgi:hypothetical protein